MGPYQNNNRRFGQTMSKSNKSSSSSRYQRQFGNSGNQSRQQSNDSSKADDIALKRRLRQEQGELIDKKFGYYRLEDQYQERQNNSLGGETGIEKLLQRRGWLFNMAATTVCQLLLNAFVYDFIH